MKPMGKRYLELTDRLDELFNEEHGGCDNLTCDMSQAMEHGYSLWALQLFAWCGAASNEFLSLFRKLPKRFKQDAERERAEFCKTVPYDECQECNAVIWHGDADITEVFCDSCNHSWKKDDLRTIILRAAKQGQMLEVKNG
jgi:hypothetical protein